MQTMRAGNASTINTVSRARARAWLLAILLTVSVAPATARADPGVFPERVILGQSAGLTGPLSSLAMSCAQGARAYFADVNARGGIHGRKIQLLARDDGYDSGAALHNANKLIRQDKVFALFGHVGWPGIEASLPAITRARIPFLFPCTGAPVLYEGFNRYVFTLRAGYAQEYRHLLRSFGRSGVRNVALVYQDDVFGLRILATVLGRDGQAAVDGLALASFAVDINSNFSALARRVVAQRPDALLLAVSDPLVNAALVRSMLDQGYHGRFFGASVVGQRGLVEELGEAARGLVITQIVPSPWQANIPLVDDYRRLMKQEGVAHFSFASMEGFIGARIVVEALRRAGPQLTRERLIAALESIDEHNFLHRGFPVSFSPTDHQGSDFVDTTMVAGEAAFLN